MSRQKLFNHNYNDTELYIVWISKEDNIAHYVLLF